MPVVNAFRSGTRREVDKSTSGRRLVEPWTVLVDTVDNPQEAVNAPQLPGDGQQLGTDPTMIVRGKRARAINLFLWEVDVEYGSIGSAQNPNPTENEAVLSWTTVELEERINFDLDGRVVANTANMPYDGGIAKPITDQVLNIQRFLKASEFDSKRQRDFKGRVNSTKFMHADPGQARMTALSGSFFKSGTTEYWDVTGAVQFKDPKDYTGVDASKLWHARKINEGFEEFGLFGIQPPPLPPIAAPGWRKILDSNGEPIARPALLKYAGNPNVPPFTNTSLRHLSPSQADPMQILYFRVHDTIDFTTFALFNGLT